MDVDDFLLKPGEQFGDYRIVSELGRGNNGVVYLAEQEPLDRKVALKILLPERSEGSPPKLLSPLHFARWNPFGPELGGAGGGGRKKWGGLPSQQFGELREAAGAGS